MGISFGALVNETYHGLLKFPFSISIISTFTSMEECSEALQFDVFVDRNNAELPTAFVF